MKAYLTGKRGAWLRVTGLGVMVAMVLSSCTGRGGGWLPPGTGVTPPNTAFNFQGRANLGFSFTCENGRLHLSLEYQEQGTYTLPDNLLAVGNPFAIHGVADRISPELESFFCVG